MRDSNRAVLLLVSRRQADEAATAFGPVGAQNKVRHSAVAGYLLEPGTLRIDLPVEVHLQGLIDRNQIVDLSQSRRVVDIPYTAGGKGRVMINPVVKRLSTQSERVIDLSQIEIFLHPGHDARVPHIVISIDQHFRPAAQVL